MGKNELIALKYIIKFYVRLISTYGRKRYLNVNTSIERNKKGGRIAVVYSIPKDSPRLNTWNDGFVNALNLMQSEFEIDWLNIETDDISKCLLESYDFLLVKSNWGWGPDKFLRENYGDLNVKKGLAVAGVSIPPSFHEMMYYDVLWYETNWYKRVLLNHPNIYHGFGINKNALQPLERDIKYDYIMIGAFLAHKRMHLVEKLEGRILVIGEEYDNEYSRSLVKRLETMPNVDIKPFVEYSKLNIYLAMARTLYIPATLNGGGERAILEARHCGLDILIEKDNCKLKEIKEAPIWDSMYYADQLIKGISSVL